MSWLRPVLGSSIGRKHVVAVTGAMLSLFVLLHLLGNLLIFAGPDALNQYAATIQSSPGIVWGARLSLLAIVLVHLVVALQLNVENKKARPVAYAKNNNVQLSFASRHMVLTGILLGVFITYHLLHFTFHIVNNTGYAVDAMGRHDVYRMVILGFQNPAITAFYIISMLVLGLHMSHGVASVFQTFGLYHIKYNRAVRCFGCAYGWAIPLANIAIALAVLLGIINLPVGG